MREAIPWCRFVWMGSEPLPSVKLPPWFEVQDWQIHPSVGYPHGWKGAVLRAAWLANRNTGTGIVWTDQDMAFDPTDVRAMRAAIATDPTAIHAAPYKIWNVDGTSHWCHRHWPDRSRPPQWGHLGDWRIDLWGFGLTYVPHALMERVEAMPGAWVRLVFPNADTELSKIALEEPRIQAYLVPDALPIHLHWYGVDSAR